MLYDVWTWREFGSSYIVERSPTCLVVLSSLFRLLEKSAKLSSQDCGENRERDQLSSGIEHTLLDFQFDSIFDILFKRALPLQDSHDTPAFLQHTTTRKSSASSLAPASASPAPSASPPLSFSAFPPASPFCSRVRSPVP